MTDIAATSALQVAARAGVQEWRLPHYLAVLGIVFIVYQSIGWIGWLADGPVQLVKYRDTESLSWKVCKFYEVVTVLSTLVIGRVVYKEVRRMGAVSFDLLFCLATFSLFWQDPMANFFQPNFQWSQNWINLNDWLGYLPFSPNPDPGRSAEPIIQDGLNYLAGWLGFVMLITVAMNGWRRQFPNSKKVHLVVVAFVVGALIDIALEAPMYYFDTWQFPGSPDIGFWANTGHKFPAYEFISGAIMFSLVAGVRYFRDDQGLRVVERGLEHHSPATRKGIVLLAMIGLFNIAYLADNSVYWFLGAHSGPFKAMPAHIVAGTCDAPGFSATRYGPCPGAPGYKMPLPGSLEGEPANNNPKWLNGPTQCESCAVVEINESLLPTRQ